MAKIEKDGKILYVCEACGCVHEDVEDIMFIRDKEFCLDCIDTMEFIEDPAYGIVAEEKI